MSEQTPQSTDGNSTEQTVATPHQQYTDQVNRPEDVAAAFFKKEKPVLKMLLSKMSAKEIRRTVMNAAAFPLIDKGDVPTTPEGKRAVLLIEEMLMNKSLMVLTQEFQKAEAAMNKQKEQPTTEGTESNG